MKSKRVLKIIIAVIFFAAFGVYTYLVQTYDVAAVGHFEGRRYNCAAVRYWSWIFVAGGL